MSDDVIPASPSCSKNNGRKFRRRRKHKRKSIKVGPIDDHLKNESVEKIYTDFSSHLTNCSSWFDNISKLADGHSVQRESIKFCEISPELQLNVGELKDDTFTIEIIDDKSQDDPQIIAESEEMFSEDDIPETQVKDDPHIIAESEEIFSEDEIFETQINCSESIKLSEMSAGFQGDKSELKEEPIKVVIINEKGKDDPPIETQVKSRINCSESLKLSEIPPRLQCIEYEPKEEPIKVVINNEKGKDDPPIETQVKSMINCSESVKLSEIPPRLQFIEDEPKEEPLKIVISDETLREQSLFAVSRETAHKDNLINEKCEIIESQIKTPINCAIESTINDDQVVNEQIESESESVEPQKKVVNQQIINQFDEKALPSASQSVEPQKTSSNFEIPKDPSEISQNEPIKVPFNIDWIYETGDSPDDKPNPIILPNCSKFFASANALESAANKTKPTSKNIQFSDAVQSLQSFKQLSSQQLPKNVPINDHDQDRSSQEINEALDKSIPHYFPELSQNDKTKNDIDYRSMLDEDQDWFNDILLDDIENKIPKCDKTKNEIIPSASNNVQHQMPIESTAKRKSDDHHNLLSPQKSKILRESQRNNGSSPRTSIRTEKNVINSPNFRKEIDDITRAFLEDENQNLTSWSQELATKSTNFDSNFNNKNENQFANHSVSNNPNSCGFQTAGGRAINTSEIEAKSAKVFKNVFKAFPMIEQRNCNGFQSPAGYSNKNENQMKALDIFKDIFNEFPIEHPSFTFQSPAVVSNKNENQTANHSLSNNPNSSGFQTAGGRAIKTTEIEAKSSKVFKNVFKAFPMIEQRNCNGFQSPARDSNKNENQMKALDIFKNIFNEFPIEHPSFTFQSPAVVNNKNENQTANPSMANNSNSCGFQTAGGRAIKTSEIEAKSSKVFKNVFKAFPMIGQRNCNGFQSPAVVSNKNENQMKALDIFKNVFNEFPIDPPKYNNFQSPAVVSNKNDNQTENHSMANNQNSCGFQTAGGRAIKTSEIEAKSAKVFKNVFKAFPMIEQRNCNGFQSPAVVSNKNENQMKALDIFKNVFNEFPIDPPKYNNFQSPAVVSNKNENQIANPSNNPNSYGFQTAGGHEIKTTEIEAKSSKVFNNVFKAFPMIDQRNSNGFRAPTVDVKNSISKPTTIENQTKIIPNNNRVRRLGSRITKISENHLKTSKIPIDQPNCNKFQSPVVDKNAFLNSNTSVPLIPNCNDFQTASDTENHDHQQNNSISSPCQPSTFTRNNGPLMTSTPITIVQPRNHQQIYSPGFTKELHEMTKALLDDEFNEMCSDNTDQLAVPRSLKPTRLSTIFETIEHNNDNSNSLIPLTNDVIIERQNALRIQQFYDRTRSITPRTGTLYVKKLVSSEKMSLREFVEFKTPCNAINSSPISIITRETFRNFHFNMIDHYPLTVCQENTAGIPLHDDISLIMNQHCQVGYDELKSAFYSCPYVDRVKIINPDDWFDNHLLWILWKFSAVEQWFSEKFHRKLLTPENVMQQLKYRYDRDVERSEMSVIRKLCENRDRLLTYDHCSFVGFISNILSENIVELSDGWYAINCELDGILSMAMVRKKIQIGTKLLIFCTDNLCVDLHGYSCSPLQIPSNVKLKLNANTCRRVKWDTKLGYYNGRNTFHIKLNSINLNGGVIACIKVQVLRIIPVNYSENEEDVPCRRISLRKRRQNPTITDSRPNKSLKLNNKTSSPKHTTTINEQLPMQLEICDINVPLKVYQLNINKNCKIINEKCTNTMINEHSIIEVTNLLACDIQKYEMLLVTTTASCIKLLSL